MEGVVEALKPKFKTELKYDEQGMPIYNFPPFPDPPDGVKIIAFKDFRPCGIQIMLNDDESELDGDGRRTVQLKVKHDLNKLPTKKKKKSKGGENIVKRHIWHEEWQEGEHLRNFVFSG